MFADAFKKTPVLHTERLMLRAFTVDDIPAYREEFSKDSVQQYLGGVLLLGADQKSVNNWLRNINDRLLKKKIVITWLITKKENTRESVGRIDLGGFTNKKAAEISYYVWEKYWGNGYAVEAVEGVVKFGFDVMELDRIQAIVHVKNARSQKALLKAGFIQEGLLRKYPLGKSIEDVFMFSVVRQSAV